MSNDKISQAIVRLFETEMFYAECVTQMRRVIDTKLPSVAGVCIKTSIELHINPAGFTLPDGMKVPGFDDLSLDERVSVLRHECEHILRDHIPRMKEVAPEVYEKQEDIADSIISNMKHKAMNIAADCAINGNMKNLPDWCIFPERFKLPNGETFEWYMQQLQNNDEMKGLTTFDDHSLWQESDEQDKEVLREKVRQVIQKAAKNTRAAGRMTSENELMISNLFPSTVNWRDQLKRFIARSLECRIESSKKKRNRRYGVMFPGDVKIEDLHIGVAADSSGSVSDEAYTQFVSEIEQIAKYAKVTFVDADCEIKAAHVWKKGAPRKRSGSGGTAYQPAFDYFNNIKDIDAVIYFGDMDSSDTPKKPKYPVLWSVVGSQNPPADFGSRIEVKVGRE